MNEEAYRCISPVCKPLGCSDCNCAVPADVYAAIGRAFADSERERIAQMFDVPNHIHGEAEDWSRAAAVRIRSEAFEQVREPR
jgi:hypothetical protein